MGRIPKRAWGGFLTIRPLNRFSPCPPLRRPFSWLRAESRTGFRSRDRPPPGLKLCHELPKPQIVIPGPNQCFGLAARLVVPQSDSEGCTQRDFVSRRLPNPTLSARSRRPFGVARCSRLPVVGIRSRDSGNCHFTGREPPPNRPVFPRTAPWLSKPTPTAAQQTSALNRSCGWRQFRRNQQTKLPSHPRRAVAEGTHGRLHH